MITCANPVDRHDGGLWVHVCGHPHVTHATHSDRANWNGAQVSSTTLPDCRASVFASGRRKRVPVATPPMPPSRFCKAVMGASMKDRVTSPRTVALSKSSAAMSNVSGSSRHTQSISFVQPPTAWRPVARLTVVRNPAPPVGKDFCRSCGRLSLDSLRVAKFFSANGAPVSVALKRLGLSEHGSDLPRPCVPVHWHLPASMNPDTVVAVRQPRGCSTSPLRNRLHVEPRPPKKRGHGLNLGTRSKTASLKSTGSSCCQHFCSENAR